jgi:hypothetical protein
MARIAEAFEVDLTGAVDDDDAIACRELAEEMARLRLLLDRKPPRR